jgi:hypothetical protein
MQSDGDPDRAREVDDAWRSAGAHALARQLVLVARSEGAGATLQAEIAAIVIATEEPVTEGAVAHAMRD